MNGDSPNAYLWRSALSCCLICAGRQRCETLVHATMDRGDLRRCNPIQLCQVARRGMRDPPQCESPWLPTAEPHALESAVALAAPTQGRAQTSDRVRSTRYARRATQAAVQSQWRGKDQHPPAKNCTGNGTRARCHRRYIQRSSRGVVAQDTRLGLDAGHRPMARSLLRSSIPAQCRISGSDVDMRCPGQAARTPPQRVSPYTSTLLNSGSVVDSDPSHVAQG